MILGNHGSSAGHFDHLVRHNGPVTDISSSHAFREHTITQGTDSRSPLNSVMMEMNMEHGGSTLGNRGSGMAKEDFLKSVRLVLILEAD